MNREETYLAKVVGNSLGVSNEKKTPSVKLKMETISCLTNKSDTENHKIYGNLWLSFKPAERSIKTLQNVFGWKGKLIAELNEPILVGKTCEIVVEWSDDFDGTERPSIKYFNVPGGVKSLEKNELDSVVQSTQKYLDALLGNDPVNTSSNISSNMSNTVLQPEDLIDDDLPF